MFLALLISLVLLVATRLAIVRLAVFVQYYDVGVGDADFGSHFIRLASILFAFAQVSD